MTLYTFDKDAPASRPATDLAQELAALGRRRLGVGRLVRREPRRRLKQWAYKGKPLYALAKDAKAGDTTGDGLLNNQWHVAHP